MEGNVATHRFTVEEYYTMYEAGLFSDAKRVELIEGEVIDMSPISSKHAMCVSRLIHVFGRLLMQQNLFDSVSMNVQNPVRLSSRSEPQPDLLLLKPKDYSAAHPGPSDVLLIVEVSDTSLGYDTRVKMPLYARSGIIQAIVVALGDEYLESYTEPSPAGYQGKERFHRGQSVPLIALPQIQISVDEILG